MSDCSVCENLQITPGCLDDYRLLARYHYLDARTGPASAIFTLRRPGGKTPVGVIVYSNAPVVLELRNIATAHVFAGLDRGTQLELINANIRRISRLVIEPRFRGLGLASRLVRDGMDQPVLRKSRHEGLQSKAVPGKRAVRRGAQLNRYRTGRADRPAAYPAENRTARRYPGPVHRATDPALSQKSRQAKGHAPRPRTNEIHPDKTNRKSSLLHLVQSKIHRGG